MVQHGLIRIVLLIPCFLFSLCVHEYAHAWMANRRGDSTARELGRLSMHPLAHLDWFGTVLLPILCLSIGAPFFGWAKPVPVDIQNLKNGHRDMTLVAAAGPVSNLLIALVSTGVLAVLIRIPFEHRLISTLGSAAVAMLQMNLMLAFFNLIPLPPLDGFNVVRGLVPRKIGPYVDRMASKASLFLVLIMVFGGLPFIHIPIHYVFISLMRWIGIQ